MKILGIDYGRKKIGLAISEGRLAEPYMVVRVENVRQGQDKIVNIIVGLRVQRIVVGISEGKMEEEAKKFGQSLSKKLNIPVETCDETLTTREAKTLSLEAGIGRKKRKSLEDSYAATLILQRYLDVHGIDSS